MRFWAYAESLLASGAGPSRVSCEVSGWVFRRIVEGAEPRVAQWMAQEALTVDIAMRSLNATHLAVMVQNAKCNCDSAGIILGLAEKCGACQARGILEAGR